MTIYPIRTLTLALVESWCPCWDTDRLRSYLARRESVSTLDVPSDQSVSRGDQMWLGLRCLSPQQVAGWSRACASRAARYAAAGRYGAAYAAAYKADRADHFASAAARYAANRYDADAAADAAIVAAGFAAAAARYAASWSAEVAAQLADLRSMIAAEEGKP